MFKEILQNTTDHIIKAKVKIKRPTRVSIGMTKIQKIRFNKILTLLYI